MPDTLAGLVISYPRRDLFSNKEAANSRNEFKVSSANTSLPIIEFFSF